MTRTNFEDLSAKLARDVDTNHKIDGSMLLRRELEQNPQEALQMMRNETARENQNNSTVRLNMNEKGEIFITDYAPKSGIHSEGIYVGMYPGYREPSAQRQNCPDGGRGAMQPQLEQRFGSLPAPAEPYDRSVRQEQLPPPPPAQPFDRSVQQEQLPPPAPAPYYQPMEQPMPPPPQQWAPAPPVPVWGPPPVIYGPAAPSVSLWIGNGGSYYGHPWHNGHGGRR